MTIHFICRSCRGKLSAPEQKAGEKATCRFCRQVVTVPGFPPPPIDKSQLDQTPPQKGPATQLLGAFCSGHYDPFEVFASVFGTVRFTPLSNPIVDELLQRDWRSLRGNDFEYFLVEVFQALGYEAEKTGKAGDKGLDVLLTIGTKRVCVQAKGYAGTVTDADDAVGQALKGMTYHKCHFCVAITNSDFNEPARDTARGVNCGLVDGATLPALIRGLLIPPAHVLLGGFPASLSISSDKLDIDRTICPTQGMRLAYTTRMKNGTWWANLEPLGGPCLGPFPDQLTAEFGLRNWLMQNEPAHAPIVPHCSPATPGVMAPQASSSTVPPPHSAKLPAASPNPFNFGATSGSEPGRSRGPGFLGSIALVLGTIVCVLTTHTKRPRNGCGACNYTWYPKGADASRQCPSCGSASVILHPDALAVGWVMLCVIALGICSIPFVLVQQGRWKGNAPAQSENQGATREAGAWEVAKIADSSPRSSTSVPAKRTNTTPPTKPFVPGEDRPALPDSVKSLREALTAGNRAQRIKAAEALGGMGSQAAEAVPELVAMIQENDDELRIAGIQALAQIGPPARAAIPLLVDRLTDSNERIQLLTVTALRRLGAPAAPQFPALLAAARNKSTIVRAYVIQAMGAVGAIAVPTLTEALRDSELSVRVAAATSLGTLGTDALPARPDLEKALKDRDSELRQAAAGALVKIGPDASTAATWFQAIKDNDPDLATHAVKALEKIGRLRKEDLPAAIELLKNDRVAVRVLAVRLLGETEADIKLGTESKPAITGLIDRLRDTDRDVREAAALALGKVGPAAWSAAPALGNMLGNDHINVRKAAVAALVKLGPDAWGATPSLIPALKNAEIHEDVLRALVGIGKEAVRPLVNRLAESRDAQERLEIVNILGQIGPDAKAAIPALTTIANGGDKVAKIRQAAKEALAKIQRKP